MPGNPDLRPGARDIIVVAPPAYKSLARRLSHQISEQRGWMGAFWNIKQYEDNEYQLGGHQYLFLIGDQYENSITKTFLPDIGGLKNWDGVCFGYDRNIAVAFGEGKEEQERAFKITKDPKTIVDQAGEISPGAKAVLIGVASLTVIPAISYYIYQYLRRKNRLKLLKQEQTKMAVTQFVALYLDEWLGVKKTEQGA